MLYSLNSLAGYTVAAKDGYSGTMEAFLFDDETWEMRYLIVAPDTRFSSSKELVATIALQQPRQETRSVPIDLTTQQVRNCPDFSPYALKTLSNQVLLHEYYQLFQYWAMSGYLSNTLPLNMATEKVNMSSDPREQADQIAFRTTDEVLGFHLHAPDGEIGVVDDMILDDESWKIRYLVMDMNAWLPEKKAWFPPQSLDDIDWKRGRMFMHLSRETLQQQPEASLPGNTGQQNYDIRIYDYRKYSKQATKERL